MKLFQHLKKNTMKYIYIIITCTISIISENMYGQEQRDKFLALSKVTIENFKCSITAQNYQFYGLSSSKGLEEVTISDPIHHYGVELNDLRKYDGKQRVNSLIREMGYVTVPLMNQKGGAVETFLLFNKKEGKYQATGMGQAPFSKDFMELKSRMQGDKEWKLVRVPAMNVAYASVNIEGVLHLIPIDVHQKEVAPQLASSVFADLASRINTTEEDVPN